MYSSAELWKQGRRVWRITHNAQKSLRYLEADGNLPASYVEKLSEWTKKQDAEDQTRNKVDFFFEIPLDATKELVGFKQDESSPGIDFDAFTVFESPSERPYSTRSKWWQIWK